MIKQNRAFKATLLPFILTLIMLPTPIHAQSPAQQKLGHADTLAQNRKYQEAAILFEEVRANYPDAFESIHAINLATIYAMQRDVEKHQELLQWQQQKFTHSNEPTDIERIEKAFLIAPYYKEEARLRESLQNCQRAIDQGGWAIKWFLLTKGIAHFHLNEFDEALALFSETTDHKNPALRAQALAYTAAIHARQGNRTTVFDVIEQTEFAIQEIPKDNWANAAVATLALNHAQRFIGTTGNAAKSARPAKRITTTQSTNPAKPTKSPSALKAAKPANTARSVAPPKQRINHANGLAEKGNYREALQILETVRQESPQAFKSGHFMDIAIYYALLEDKQGHAEFSNWLLDYYAQSTSPWDTEHAAKAYLLYPGANDPKLLEKAHTLAKNAVDIGTDGSESWIFISLAMAKIRLDQFDQAETWLQKAYEDTDRIIIHFTIHAFRALKQAKQNNKSAAQQSIEKAQEALTKIQNKNNRDIKIAELAIQEAQELLRK